jgi:hypothetical protein
MESDNLEISSLVDEDLSELVDESTSDACVLDLRAVKDARRMADLHYKVNGVRSSTKEVLGYAVSLQIFHKESSRYS